MRLAGALQGTWLSAELDPTERLRLVYRPTTLQDIPEFEAWLSSNASVGGDAVTVVVELFADRHELASAFGITPPGEQEVVEAPGGEPNARRPDSLGTLAMDVPTSHVVRAFRGAFHAYLADYDIEVGNGLYGVDAVVDAEDVGVAASGRLVRDPHGNCLAALDVEWTPQASIVEIRCAPPSGSDPLLIEEFHPLRAEFRGQIPARPGGRWLVGLSHGAGALVSFGAFVPGSADVPGWRSAGLSEWLGFKGLGRMDVTDPEVLDVVVEGPSVPGGSAHVALLASLEGLWVGPSTLPAPAFTLEDLAIGLDVRPSIAAPTLEDLAGGVRMAAIALPDEGGARAFDLVLDAGFVVDDAWREIFALSLKGAYRLRLPETQCSTVPFRVRLVHGETTVRDIPVDVAGRQERWRFTIERR